ncbi:hypothetical protein AB1L30_25465 [Bremerella sp. JC817]|uniref:cupin domain-containing protein n=1 Tax=Bremerella sp. JC817 TaxID=3231756 RepID=UPI00345986C4
MPTASTKLIVQDLPGIDETTQVTRAPEDTDNVSSVDARYLRLKTREQVGTQATVGEATIFCVAGNVDVLVRRQHYLLGPNQLLYVAAGSPFRLEAEDESAVLITTLSKANKTSPEIAISTPASREEKDTVQEALEETFPASDPPSYNSTIT